MSNSQVSNYSLNHSVLTAPTTLWSLTNVHVTSVWTWSVTISWDIMPSASKYYVYAWAYFSWESADNNENVLTISNLLPNTTYTAKVVWVEWSWTFWNFAWWNWVAWFWVKQAVTFTTNP